MGARVCLSDAGEGEVRVPMHIALPAGSVSTDRIIPYRWAVVPGVRVGRSSEVMFWAPASACSEFRLYLAGSAAVVAAPI